MGPNHPMNIAIAALLDEYGFNRWKGRGPAATTT